MTKEIDNKKEIKPINEDAKYMYIFLQNKRILVDMNDIKEIKPLGVQNLGNKKNDIFQIVFNDDYAWQAIIDDDNLKIYNEFKKSA